jgi:hypothetical protein
MAQSVHLALVPPTDEKFTVRLPRRKPNAGRFGRRHRSYEIGMAIDRPTSRREALRRFRGDPFRCH